LTDREPVVLIVGGGHAGLSVAARLGQLGVDTLVVDRMKRIGDNWRLRYSGLVLHNQVHSNHLPYMPYPSTWQPYLPKDRIANWLETYVDCMDINFWTQTSFEGAEFDAAKGEWQAHLKFADGATRTLRPRHIIMATSVSGTPNIPSISTLEKFAGKVVHSSEFGDGSQWRGQHILIMGTGTSAHDIAQDLHANGAGATLVQRSSTLVVGVEPSAQLYEGVFLGDGPSLEDRDLINTSIPMKLMLASHKLLTDKAKAYDRPLLEALEKVGFRLNYGVDGTGWPYLFRTRGGGYYFNVGCSDLIADGSVGLLQYQDIDTFTADGVIMKDGRKIQADAVVLATGFKGHGHIVDTLFGPEVATKVGPIWGVDSQTQELRNMWMRTGQRGLWFTGGPFSSCRAFSKYLALQIKASELGLLEI
jgi:putative flavoprotein involved in K+ transport